jgi:hypothetical protein
MSKAASVTREGRRAQPELFIAYAEQDSDWVHGFLLPEVGLDRQSVLTPEDFRPGAAVVEEFERAVVTARFIVLVLSPAFGMSQWPVFADLMASHDSLRQDSGRLIPVLLEPYELPLHLDFRVRLDCTVRSRWETEAARLRDLLQRAAPPAEQLPCPYPGLIAFGPEDVRQFFGRERESDDISRRVMQQSFLLVVGPSGSGKSSLVAAGVLPRLRAADANRWLIKTLRPDTGALRSLIELLGGEGSVSGGRLGEAVDALLSTAPGAERVLLFFDQAEAIFLLPSKQERTLFLSLLDRLRRVDRCVVVLAMRADFYADLMTSVLWPVSRGERVEIGPLRSAALREAIVRPAAKAGVYLEPVLVERLVRDAGEEPGALSLVQETMVLLWERKTRRLLTVSAYEDLGGQGRSGLAAALATRADAALAALSPAQQGIARRMFVRLVQLGEGRQDTRRPQAVSALRVPGDDPALFDSTLRHLTDRRLLTIGGDGSEEPAADLGHEAMIAHWPALRDWIDDDRADEMARRRIERDADDWQHNGRDQAELYRRRKLANAVELASRHQHELSRNAMRFLAAGRRRRLLGRLGLGTAAAAALAGIVWLAWTPARDAWLRHEAQRISPTVTLAGGPAIVGPDNRRVKFPQLQVDIHEVTNQQYRYCVQALRCSAPLEPASDARFAHGDHDRPVVWVTAYDAEQFCTWLGRRLPTEPEWERIARGTDGSRYPWGNTPPQPSQVNATVGARPPGHLMPADSPGYRSGDSSDKVEQLIGNVQEWTATPGDYIGDTTHIIQHGNWNGQDRVPNLIVIGGGYLDPATPVVASRIPATPTTVNEETGFRCVATTN